MIFTKVQLLDLLIDNAKLYHLEAKSSVIRNTHMNNLKVTEHSKISQDLIDAVLVDFINFVAYQQGLDLGLYTKDVYKIPIGKRK